MDNATTIALSRLMAQSRAMDLTAANIANANTQGYRAGHMLFSDWLLHEPAASRTGGEASLAYAQDRATYRDQKPGSVTHTGNPLDLAIGDAGGYFTVGTKAGPRLTRAGHFELSATGTVVDSEGNALLDTAGRPLAVTPADTDLTIGADGMLASQNGQIGRIGVVTPTDPTRLRPEGDHLSVSDTPTTATAQPRLIQGGVEDSNVVAVAEVTRMMSDTREFQFVAQFVQGESDRQNGAIEKLSQRPV